MKKGVRDIISCIAAIAITVLAVWFYFQAIESERTTVQTDLYALIAPQPEAILAINRPALFTKVILSQEPVHKLIESHIPDIFLKIAGKHPALSFLLFSVHPQGTVLYAKANDEQAYQIETEIVKPLFNTYPPQFQKKNGITFTYYPDTENHFFGFYHHKGAFVASYSKKLLEAAAALQLKEKPVIAEDINEFRKLSDKNAPLNIAVPANPLNLYVPLNDSVTWVVRNQWLIADLFASENNLCCYGSLPYDTQLDTLYAPMADTLSLRLEKLLPALQITHEINQDGKRIYYTGCSPLEKTTPSENTH